jgi:hypothetical protein
MRFMMMIKATEEFEAGRPPNAALMAGMGKLTEEMQKAGVLLSSEGLHPSAKATRLAYSGGKRNVTDGPFTEAKELIGGFAIVRAASKAEAMALADRVLQVHIDAGILDFEMEIRPLYDMGDFPCGK